MDNDGKKFVKTIQEVWNDHDSLHSSNKKKITQQFVLETLLEISKNTEDKKVSKLAKQLEKKSIKGKK